MITALLLLPVTAVLVWFYRHFLPCGARWSRFDSGLLLAVAVLALAWVVWARSVPWQGAGPVYAELVAAAGAYPILVAGLAAGLAWRRLRARGAEPGR